MKMPRAPGGGGRNFDGSTIGGPRQRSGPCHLLGGEGVGSVPFAPLQSGLRGARPCFAGCAALHRRAAKPVPARQLIGGFRHGPDSHGRHLIAASSLDGFPHGFKNAPPL